MPVGLGALVVGVAILAGAAVEGARSPSRMGREASQPSVADWEPSLRQAEAARRAGDLVGAERAWEEAYRVAIVKWEPAATVVLGRSYLEIGTEAHGQAAAADRARRIFMSAFYQARALRSPAAMADASEALAAIGEDELAIRGFALAVTVAERGRDARLIDRITSQRDAALGIPTEQSLTAPSRTEVWTR